jgi:Big-like domain-containing protein
MRFGHVRLAFGWMAVAAMLLVAAPPAAAQSAGWQPGPGAILDNTYDGFIDSPSNGATIASSGNFLVSGWFVDKQAQGWAGADDMQVFLGQMGSGGTMIAHGVVAQNRPDVAAALGNPFWAASGFFATVPGSAVPAGAQTLNVYMHTGGKGWWFKSVSVTGGGSGTGSAPAAAPAPAPSGSSAATGAPQVTIINPAAESNVSTKSDYTITGTATTPGIGPSDIDRVDVYINGEKDTGTLLGETTPASDGSWAVTFKPTRFPSTHSNIYVFAHSKSTGKETEVIRGFNITDRSV